MVIGCGKTELHYQPNTLVAATIDEEHRDDGEIHRVAIDGMSFVETLFGTLEDPKWPTQLDDVDSREPLVDMDKVRRAAGAVGRGEDKVERGLYRKHCVQCHGLSGDGLGPAAMLLAPYPRDFRRGTFKFKSTGTGIKPTHADIVQTLRRGIPGTSMPAFETLTRTQEFSEDVDALAHYVRFLAIRGEVERRAIRFISNGDSPHTSAFDELTLIQPAFKPVIDAWVKAPKENDYANPTLRIDVDVADWKARVERGRTLFASELTACTKCHGEQGKGDGKSQDFDEWTKDWTIRAGIDPTIRSQWSPMKRYGALKPILDPPRNLHLGAFRSGPRSEDLYLRIQHGIEGTPMPPIAIAANGNPGVSEQDIWDLVLFVESLSNRRSQSNSRASAGSGSSSSGRAQARWFTTAELPGGGG